MTIKIIAEKEITSCLLLTGEQRAFVMKIEMPRLSSRAKYSFYSCRIDYGWLGDKMDSRVRCAAEQGTGLSSMEAIQDAISKEYRLPMYVKGYTFSRCDNSCLLAKVSDLPQLLSISEVMRITGKSQDTLYAWAKLYFFPEPIVTGPHAGKFRSEEVKCWCDDPSDWHNSAWLLAMCNDCQYKKAYKV